MARNNKKNNSKSTNDDENVYCAEKWPNLPQQLINFIEKKPHLNLFENIGSAGVTKSWKKPKNKCHCPNPKSPILELQPTCLRRNSFCGQFLFSKWDSKIAPLQRAAFSYSLPDQRYYGCNLLAITGCSSPAFGVNRFQPRDPKSPDYFISLKAWTKHDATLVDPNDSDKGLMKFTSVVGSKGKFYALTLQGTLAVIEDVGSEFRVTRLCRKRVVPSSPSRCFIEYLIEYDGEILVVFLMFGLKDISVVDDVEVFKLRQAGDVLSLVETKSLGDKTIFVVIDCSICVTASLVGCRSNAIYFAHHLSVNSWRLYDMETRSILPCHDSYGSRVKSPVWEEFIGEDFVPSQQKVK